MGKVLGIKESSNSEVAGNRAARSGMTALSSYKLPFILTRSSITNFVTRSTVLMLTDLSTEVARESERKREKARESELTWPNEGPVGSIDHDHGFLDTLPGNRPLQELFEWLN